MKSKLLYVLIAGFACFMLSCEKDKTTDRIYVTGKRDPFATEELVFTGDDIKSYNISTFEITLSDSAIDKLFTKQIFQQQEYMTFNYLLLSFYYNDKILFKNVRTINTQSGGSTFNDLVFVADLYPYSNKLYLSDGYPVVMETEWYRYGDNEYVKEIQKEKEENAKKRELEWNIFIRCLTDSDKIEDILYAYNSAIEVVDNVIYRNFSVKSMKDGSYYLDAWIMVGVTDGRFPEYKVLVNGVLSESTFKPQTTNWHSLALTDTKRLPATVKLSKGINTVSVVGKVPEVPMVQFIKLALDPKNAEI